MSMESANQKFLTDATTTLYGTGKYWSKKMPDGFSPRTHEYMRMVEEEDNTMMLVFDLDAEIGINGDLLMCARSLYEHFGRRGILKASGAKGVHVIPFKVRFRDDWSRADIRRAVRDIAYSACREVYTLKNFGMPFYSRTGREGEPQYPKGYVDAKMYSKGRMVRGFCRRFNKDGAIEAWSVPFHVNDDMQQVADKVCLKTEPNWDFDIPTVFFSEELRPFRVPDKRKKIHKYRREGEVELIDFAGSDSLPTIMRKLYEAMPPKLKNTWDAHDPAHQMKFAVVCWLNRQLLPLVRDKDKRIELVTSLLIEFMPLGTYRKNGRFSPSMITYQVEQIIQINQGLGYDPPAWIWEEEIDDRI